MKRFFACVLAAVLLLSLCACGGNAGQTATEPVATTQSLATAPKSLKVLAIGNSFSVDAMTYLYQIAEKEGVEEIVLGNFFVGACTLKMHADYMESGDAAYRYDKNTNGTWVQTPDTTLLTGLLDEEWDVITMQQASQDSGIVTTYQPYLNNLIAYVQEKCPNAKIMWHMTWAYQSDSDHKAFPNYGNEQMSMYYGIVNCLQKEIDTNANIAATIPSGTVIQNLRNSVIGDALTRDGYHLNNLGKLAAGYAWYAILADQPIQSVKLSALGKTPVTEQQQDLIVKAVNAALEKPQAVTPVK